MILAAERWLNNIGDSSGRRLNLNICLSFSNSQLRIDRNIPAEACQDPAPKIADVAGNLCQARSLGNTGPRAPKIFA